MTIFNTKNEEDGYILKRLKMFKDTSKSRNEWKKKLITQLEWDNKFEKLILQGINSIKAVNMLDKAFIICDEEQFEVY